MDYETYGAIKTYVNNTMQGAGAVSGKPCQIQDITPISGGNRVTFLWEDNSGASHLSTMEVMDGATGPQGTQGPRGTQGPIGPQGIQGETGIGIRSMKISNQGHLIITYTDDTESDLGVLPSGDSILKSDVTATVAVGAITVGTTIEQGTTFTEFVQKLLGTT